MRVWKEPQHVYVICDLRREWFVDESLAAGKRNRELLARLESLKMIAFT
jgi:hypothetical protein